MRNTTTAPLDNPGKLLTEVTDDRDRMLFACALYLGLRRNELVALKWEDLDGESVSVFQSKTKKFRKIAMHPELKKIVSELRGGRDGLIFTGRRGQSGDKPLTNAGVNGIIRKWFKVLGITSSSNDSSHCLRKTFANSYFSANGRNFDSLLWLSRQLGHSSVQITLRYIGIDDEVQSQNICKIQY